MNIVILNKLLTGKKKSLIELGGSLVLGQLVALAVIPVITRIYQPDDFGQFAIYVGIVGIFGLVAGFRYELLVLKLEQFSDIHILSLLVLLIGLMMSVLFLFVFQYISGFELGFLKSMPENQALLLGVGIFFFFFYQLLLQHIIRSKDYTGIAISRLLQMLTAALFPMGIFFVSSDAWVANGLIFGYLLGFIFSVLFLLHRTDFFRNLLSVLQDRRVTQNLVAIFLENRSFGMYTAPAALFNSISLLAPSILLGMLYSTEVAGLYELGRRLIGAPVAVIGISVKELVLGEVSSRIRTGMSVRNMITRSMLALFFLAALPVLFLGFFLSNYAVFLFGNEWAETAKYIPWITLSAAAQVVVAPFAMCLLLVNYEKSIFYFDISRGATILVLFLFSHLYGWPPEFLVSVFTSIMLFYYMILAYLIQKNVP